MRIAWQIPAELVGLLVFVNITGAEFRTEAVFCIFDCSARVRPTWPGRCLEPVEIFATQNMTWLTLETRYHIIVPPKTLPAFRPEWLDLVKSDMTWEGWFRILAPPYSEQTSLMGTAGANHDTTYWVLADSWPGPDRRRRFGAVFIDSGGYLNVRSNTGKSTGFILGPNVSDARWHHVAVAWQPTTGGQQIDFRFKVLAADLLVIQEKPALDADIKEIIHTFLSDKARVSKEHVYFELWDDCYRKPIPKGWYRFGVNATINPPTDSDFSSTVSRLSHVTDLIQELSVLLKDRIYQEYPNGGYPVRRLDDGPIVVAHMKFPVVIETGSAHLYVDYQKHPGQLTYDPGIDNIATDQQLVIAGGHLGRTLHAEVRRFRLWDRSLTASELQEISQCRMPTVSSITGGEWPHNLMAEYPLNGNLDNVRGTDFPILLSNVSHGAGRFVRGGKCNHERCPEASEEGCPLMKSRALKFNASESCDNYARFNFCRTAGPNRQGMFRPEYEGCHVGAGNPIAEITV